MRQLPRCPAPPWVIALVLVLGGAHWGDSLLAQQHAADTTALETIQIRPNVFVIFGAGSNITAHVGEYGVILVDSGSAAMADTVVQAVKAITNQPIRLIINTSADADHVGGNETISLAGQARPAFPVTRFEGQATVLAHANVLLRMSDNEKLYPTASWPTATYTSRVRSMYLNDDALQVIRQFGALSDGDSMVLFRKADVIATGGHPRPAALPDD